MWPEFGSQVWPGKYAESVNFKEPEDICPALMVFDRNRSTDCSWRNNYDDPCWPAPLESHEHFTTLSSRLIIRLLPVLNIVVGIMRLISWHLDVQVTIWTFLVLSPVSIRWPLTACDRFPEPLYVCRILQEGGLIWLLSLRFYIF